MNINSKPLLYTPDWLVSFEKEAAGEIVLSQDHGGVICDYRKRYGMTQEELGELMELRRESISRIENGSVTPTFEFVKKFINAMALIEAIRVERAQHKEIDLYFLENLAKELGFSREKLMVMLKVAVESYDKKLVKIQKSLKEKKL
ncbi:MAG: helix-turn-helix transcriptional regulator [Candidatus Methanoperedens sp.]|nr:helix-turn-helix transcriptional regulator [Candidatus Methanoperedens sp.]MCZ7395174.1 helix-turn-helix transcriptional regulator [Candidatus Methanoperedens sp.]